jgi:predicted lipid-binding transport protein (Tim44 family)
MLRWPAGSRFLLWVAVCALLLKSAMPMLASTAAYAQGKPVAEICAVYGVAPPAAATPDPSQRAAHAGHDAQAAQVAHAATHAGHSQQHGSHQATAHGAEHCALVALAAFAAGDTLSAVLPAATPVVRAPPLALVAIHDASAKWFARMKQGPPVRA